MPRTAVVITDMLNQYDFDDGDKLAAVVEERLPTMVRLRDRAREDDDALLMYVNDNHDEWHAGRRELTDKAKEGRHPELIDPIEPSWPLPFFPKGRHSIFYETAVDHVLKLEDVKRVVLVGQVTEQCILYSALDAYLRGHEIVIPHDAVAHLDEELGAAALKMMETNMHAVVCPAADIEF